MAGRCVLIIMLMYCIMVLDLNLTTGFKLLMEENRKLEKQFKLLNKPPITTIQQTKYGESYDCVDFYQQPAFDHPLLRDDKYKYQISPSNDNLNEKSSVNPFDIWLNRKGCPSNTVPIKRITKKDLHRINMASKIAYNSLNENPGVHVAVLRTTQRKKYYGGGMAISVYHPSVKKSQYSSSRIIVQNGIDSIAVGWTVNPSLYPDNTTRLFIYTNTKNSHCYNTYCPGFIITRSDIPLDMLLKPYSVPGKSMTEKNVFIGKDTKKRDWYLAVGVSNTIVGYWPQKIFTNLADSANYIEWGGEVYSPRGTTPPPMGSGRLPTRDVNYNCFGRIVSLINEHHQLDRNPSSCTPYHTSKKYKLIDAGYVASKVFERVIIFGGK
ncbi:hypothetical protein LINPERHAP2_LOCUS40085 [Linum perenne]